MRWIGAVLWLHAVACARYVDCNLFSSHPESGIPVSLLFFGVGLYVLQCTPTSYGRLSAAYHQSLAMAGVAAADITAEASLCLAPAVLVYMLCTQYKNQGSLRA